MPLTAPTVAEIERRIHLRLAGQQVALTDLTTISVTRILIREMIVEELKELWDGLVADQRDWFVHSAEGDALDRRLADFGLEREPASAATGRIEVQVSADTEVPSGAVVRTVPTDGSDPKRYRVSDNPDTANKAWPITAAQGSRDDIVISAADAGAAGNTAAGTIVEFETPVADATAVQNPVPLIDGRDAASDSEFRQYFRDYLQSLTRGTRGALLFAVLNYVDPDTGAKPVHSAAIEEWGGQTLLSNPADPTSSPVALRLYIEDGTGSASSTLLDTIRDLVDGSDVQDDSGLRAAGVPTVVLSATPLPLRVDVALDVDRAFNPETVQQAVSDAISDYLGQLPVSGRRISGEIQGQLNFAQLFRAVMNVPGVLRATFSTPTADLAIPTGYKVVPGTLNVSVASVT